MNQNKTSKGSMALNIKIFVIQWRKFEAKGSSRNEVMNF